jgi:hypothetical protein
MNGPFCAASIVPSHRDFSDSPSNRRSFVLFFQNRLQPLFMKFRGVEYRQLLTPQNNSLFGAEQGISGKQLD